MNKVWNIDHYDYIETVTDSDGHELQAVIKCEMENNTMNSYTTTQGTVKIVNPETNGQVKPARNKIAEVEKMLADVLYKKPLTNEQKERLWTVCLIHQLGWLATHEQIEARLNEPMPNSLEKLMQAHNEKIKDVPLYKFSVADCAHTKETGSINGILCSGCGRTREPVSDFEKRLVGRYKYQGNGYVNYQGR